MTKNEKALWKRIMACWDDDSICCRFHLAKRYTQEYPTNQYGWVALADALWRFARYDEAREALRTAERLSPPEKLHQIYHQIALLYEEKSDERRAERWHRKTLDLKVSCGNLIFLGACLARQGKLSDAKALHRRATRFKKGDPDEAHLNLGYILRAEESYHEALKHFDAALRISPDYEEAKEAKQDILKLLKMMKKR